MLQPAWSIGGPCSLQIAALCCWPGFSAQASPLQAARSLRWPKVREGDTLDRNRCSVTLDGDAWTMS